MLTGSSDADHRPHLRRRTWRCCGRRPKRSRRCSADIAGHRRRRRSSRRRKMPQIQIADGPGGGPALRPEARRRPPRGGRAGRRRGGRRHLPRTARPTTCTSGARRGSATASTQHPEPADRHPERQPGASGRRGRGELVPTPNVIKHENLKRSIDVDGQRRGPDLGSVVAGRRAELAHGRSSRWSTTPSCSASTRSARPRRSGCCSWPIVAVDRRLPAAPDIVPQLAPRHRWPSSRCRWRWWAACSAAYLSGGIISLGSLVGFLTVFGIAARNGIMLISHFQHLEQRGGRCRSAPSSCCAGARSGSRRS